MDDDLAQLCRTMEKAAPDEFRLAFRAIVGGLVVYANGRPFGSITTDGIALKLAGPDRTELLATKGASPMRLEGGRSHSRHFIVLPRSIVSNAHVLGHWIGRSARKQQNAASAERRPHIYPAWKGGDGGRDRTGRI